MPQSLLTGLRRAAAAPLALTPALAFTVALAISPAAQAADASASVQITGFSLSTDAGLTLSWNPASLVQSLFAESREAGGLGGNQLREPDPGTWSDTTLQTSTAHAAASVQAGSSGLGGVLASASRALVDPLAQPHTGASWLQQSGEFSLSGAGQVRLVLDYVVSATASATDGNDTWAYGALNLSFGNLFSGQVLTEQVQVFSVDPLLGSGAPSGRLQLDVAFDGPTQTGFYDLRLNANASAVAAVPEPAHWALMLCGLGLLAWRRQRSGR